MLCEVIFNNVKHINIFGGPW